MTPATRPFAITMWDFSWLERRWPGAGYEDWDQALGELAERGYDAVRIDPYPHLLAADPKRTWHLVPLWTQVAWGAQSPIDVRVGPELIEFIGKAKAHGIRVALSSWYRRDAENTHLHVRTAQDQAEIWVRTLDHIRDAGLADQILYVDLCNEFPHRKWAAYLYPRGATQEHPRSGERMARWMRESIALVRERHPRYSYTYSFATQLNDWRDQDVSMLDFLENHIWMASPECSEFNDVVGFAFDAFVPDSFDALVRNGRREYASRQAYYDKRLFDHIDDQAEWSRHSNRALVTTECWTIIDYKDWPGLDWAWVNDLNARAVEHAAAKGRWLGIATSNFCGPQFVGAWRDVAWHRRLTDVIKAAPVAPGMHPVAF
jgi:sugar phosphate isomerase/epimerase